MLYFKIREIEILKKKLAGQIWFPWKRQVTWTVTCHIKLLPDIFFRKKSRSWVSFDRDFLRVKGRNNVLFNSEFQGSFIECSAFCFLSQAQHPRKK